MLIPTLELSRQPDARSRGAYDPELDRDRLVAEVSRWGRLGEVLIVDRDAEQGIANHQELIGQLTRLALCRIQAAISTEDRANFWLRHGSHRLVIRVPAASEVLARLPRRHLLAQIAWPANGAAGPGAVEELVRSIQILAPQVSGFVCSAAGSLSQVHEGAARQLFRATSQPITVAVDAASTDDLIRFDRMGHDVACPVAAITPPTSAEEVLIRLLDFSDGPLSTIVSDQYGQVLLLARSSQDSLRETITSGRCRFADTEVSGHRVLRLRVNCRRNALWISVVPHGRSCERNAYSCFGDGTPDFGLARMADVIRDRRERPLPGSYTSFLFEKDDRLPRKLHEEVYELLSAPTRDNLVWEAADVLYFYLAFLARKGVTLDEVITELRGREQ